MTDTYLGNTLRIRGARTHNLKNIDLDIPKHTLTVITGVSGSGKSSLAFDTLYAEGQRRYVESLSTYARQFLQLMNKPDVDLIEGLSPAISIEQKTNSHNPRSTVGTVTEIHDYLRLLFARAGIPHCPYHVKIPLIAYSVSQMVDTLLKLPVDTKIMMLSPVVIQAKGTHQDLIKSLQAQGFIRIRLTTGKDKPCLIDISECPPLKKTERHTIEVVIDRLKIKASSFNTSLNNDCLNETELNEFNEHKQRYAESLETALNLSHGRVIVVNMDDETQSWVFSNRFACTECGFALKELEPRLFSFNNPAGACESCSGLGEIQTMSPVRIVANPTLSLSAGAIKGWGKNTGQHGFYYQALLCLANHYEFSLDTPWNELPKPYQDLVLFGTGDTKIALIYTGERGSSFNRIAPFEGVVHNIERRYKDTDSQSVKEDLARYIHAIVCKVCQGARLKPEALNVRLIPDTPKNTTQTAINHALNIYELSHKTLAECLTYFETLQLSGSKQTIAQRIVREIIDRLTFLNNVGLNYLSLDRSASTLSGGESQRIRLASQIGSGLTGVLYVLDEPSIGLHQRDNDRLIQTLHHLRNLGNTVLVVEHDEDMIRQADCVIDIGIGAGEHGGNVIAMGTPNDVLNNIDSLTGDYLSGRKTIKTPTESERKQIHKNTDYLSIIKASGNNLKHIDVNIPIGLLTCITGVSGSGKSTLINDTLYKAVAQNLYGSIDEPAPHQAIQGLDFFDKVINVDQSAIGRTPRSNPATYTGLFTPIRELFANIPEAKARGYQAGRFSFNVKGGRCEACQGDGVVKVEMHFLPDVYVSCDTCLGQRYNRETLDIRWKGLNIAQILDLTVEQAYTLFQAIPSLNRKLSTLKEVGLTYIKLGQNATTLSGGEAQRIKLALELSKRDTGRTMYILDEPTTGLHFHDVAQLLSVLHKLRHSGNTVIIIEHNLDVIKTADYIIDIGPEGGENGGTVLIQGTPETVAQCEASYTGQYLKPILFKQ